MSDRDLSSRLASGELGIEPFQKTNLTPNGYDLTIGELYWDGATYTQGEFSFPPLAWFAVATRERIRLGRRVCGQLWLRSTWIRRGIIASFGKVDAGFEGALTLPAFNASPKEVRIAIGETFAQIVFEDLSTDADLTYGERSGRYQGKTGITLE